ncbi:glycosyltransferase [Porticoccus sp.]
MIANIMYSPDVSHWASQLIHRLISRSLKEHGLPVEEFFLVGGGAPAPDGPDLPVITSSRMLRRKGLWRCLPSPLAGKLAHLLTSRQVSAVVCDGLGVMRALLPVLGRHDGLSLVVVVHGLVRFKPQDLDGLKAHGKRIRLVAVSPSLALDITARYPVLQDIVNTVVNTLNPEFGDHLFDREAARSLLGLPVKGHLSVVASRLTEKKDVATVIRAFAKVFDENRYLVIMGDGPEREALEALAETLGVDENVIWLGWIKSASQYLKAFDVLVSASTVEGFGLSVLEAYAAGLPVVCSRIPAHEDALDGQGAFFDVGNVDECARKLATVGYDGSGCDLLARYNQFASGYMRVLSELHP